MTYDKRQRKKSSFTSDSDITNDSLFDFVKSGINRKAPWSDIIDKIADVYGLGIRLYETESAMIADTDLTLGDHAIVEENRYALYEVSNIAAVAGDVTLSNGLIASHQGKMVPNEEADYVALRALNSSAYADGEVITVTNDGIAGQFIVKTGTVTDNGGTRIVPADDSNRYFERFEPQDINIDWFGAVGDGVSDDTPAYISALSHCSTLNSSTLLFNSRRSYLIGSSTAIVSINNLTLDFNNCKLICSSGLTSLEITPQTLIDSGRKAGDDFPIDWRISGVPTPFDGDWRSMMHEEVDADRLNGLTVRNCKLDSDFAGTLIQAFSVDSVKVYNSELEPSNSSGLRLWHCRDVDLYNSTFGGSGTYSVFFYKCQGVGLHSSKLTRSGGSRNISFKGSYHGSGSIFLAADSSFRSMDIRIHGNSFENTNPTGDFGVIDLGDNPTSDVMTDAGGSAIGFTRQQWMSMGVKNIIINDNSYYSDSVKSLFSILLPNENVMISGNKAVNGVIFLAGSDTTNINSNSLVFSAGTATALAAIAVTEDNAVSNQGIPKDVTISENSINGFELSGAGSVIEAVRLEAERGEVSDNKLSLPGVNVTHFLNIPDVTSDFIYGDNNITITDNASGFAENAPVRTQVGANANGGTVRCGFINIDTNAIGNIYKESNFVATIEGSTTAGVGTYGSRSARYSITDNRVSFDIVIPWSAHTGTGNILVQGLPFTANDNASANFKYPVSVICNALVFAGQLTAYINPGESSINIASFSSAGALTSIPMDTNATLYISGSIPYKT